MAMGMGQQFLASLTGNIEQARLIIYDYRDSVGAHNKDTAALIRGKQNMSTTQKNSAIANLNSKCAMKMKNFRDGATEAEAGGDPFVDTSKTKTFLVHFNPSQLQIYATNLPVSKPDATGKNPVHDSVTKSQLTLTVSLFFDEMNVYDSFMADKFTAGATAQGVKNVASSIAKATGKIWSVQDEVEGLVAALRNPYTRNVSFRWADFAFTGQLSNISAKYTMFSTSGRPVRAQVLMRIQHEMDDIYLKSWYDSYSKAFSGESSSLTSASQKVGNVLNFNL